MWKPLTAVTVVAAAVMTLATIVQAQQEHAQGEHAHQGAVSAMPATAETRQLVTYPDALRRHTLASMRDHLLALQQIQGALAAEQYDTAGRIAAERLGMDSLALHGAHEAARFMPEGMQAIGTRMHRAASQFSLVVNDTSVTGDVKPALAALANLTEQCVACHAGYRLHP